MEFVNCIKFLVKLIGLLYLIIKRFEMLENFDAEIKLLSNKRISDGVLDSTLKIINSKLPKTKKEIKKLFDFSVSSLMHSIKLKEYEIFFGLARFVFLANFPNSFVNIRKKGVLRASKYGYESTVLEEIVKCLYDKKYFTEDELRYLSNINELLKIAPDIKKEKLKVVSAIKSRKNFLKNSLALGEIIFNDLHYDVKSFFSKKTLHEEFFSKNKESVLESISLICQFHKEIYQKINLYSLISVDEGVDEEFYKKIFFRAYKIKEFNEAEIKLDFYDYDLICNEKDRFLLVNDNFEKCKVFGYAKMKMRNLSRNTQIYKEVKGNLYSLDDYLNNFFEKEFSKKNPLYSIEKNPIERIVVLTYFFTDTKVFDLFSSNTFFLEEYISLITIVEENYNENLLEKKLYKDFTVLDLIKIQRYFYYIGFIYKKAYELEKNKKGENYASLLRRRSVIPVIKDDEFYYALSMVLGKEKELCKEFIDKFTNFYENKGDVIDLQYKPLFKSNNYYVLMPTIFSFSNLIRSFSINEKIHLSSYDDIDYMMEELKKALNSKNFFVEKDFEFGEDEIDIIAFKENHLFLFECKNPYHPVNDFELRNTFDHLVKGLYQLEKIKNIVSNPHKLKDILFKLGIPFSKNIEIHYGVINANRSMYGYKKNEYKVFHANEMINFLTTGIISIGEVDYNCWDSDNFRVQDFVDYINGSKLTNDFHETTVDIAYYIGYEKHCLGIKTFSFDQMVMSKIVKEKYREVS